MNKALEEKVELYAGVYDEETNTYNIYDKPLHTFKNMKAFEQSAGIPALGFYIQHPMKTLRFCYCLKGQDINNIENLTFITFGFMEEK